MSEETNDQPLINKSQHTGHINISGNEDPVVNLVNTIQGITNIDQRRTIIYNYNSQEQTVTTSTEKDIEDNLICPYQGLYHFSPEKAEYFFGRDVFIEELFQYTETRNFIPILGASGSGKSSVILAGLVPKLVKTGHWQFTHFRPGNDPFHALAQALVPLYEPNLTKTELIAEARKLERYFQDNTVPLCDVFSTIQRNHPNNRILLIADQFEELYTLCNDEQTRRQFLDLLLTTFKSFAEQSSLSTVLVGTMRADFLGNVLSYRPLADVLQKGNIMLGPMNETELRDIIEKPAQKLGVSFESGLVERILDDVDKEPGNLPLLEFALTELWNKRKGKQLTHNAYQEIGEVSGALTGYADSQFSKLKPEQQQQVRRIFVQLVRPGAGTEDTRRVATKAELNDSNWNLVRLLADARLVVTSRTVINSDNSQQQTLIKEQETVEVVHEALIKNWGQLRQWMETDREFRTWQERLRTAMNYWQEKNRDQGLLLRGAALVQAAEQLKTRRDELSQDEQEYIQLSQNDQQRQRQRTIGLLTAGFVTISGIAAVAVWQWQKALIGEENANFKTEITTLEPRFHSSLPVQMDVIDLNKKLQQAKEPTVDIEIQGADLLRRVVTEPRELNRLEGHQNTVIAVAFNPDGELLATGSYDKTVKLWSSDGTLVKSLEGHQDLVYAVAFNPDGELLATGSYDKTVKLWSSDGTLVKSLEGYQNTVIAVAFSSDGKLLLTTDSDNTVKLWKADGTLVKSLEGDRFRVNAVAFSPDVKLLATGSRDKTVKLWSSDGTLVKTLEGHQDLLSEIAFSPDGKLLATGSYDNTVKLWSSDGTLVKTLEGYEIAFSPDGKLLATGSRDKTVKLWSSDGTLVKTLEGHQDSLSEIAFSPDGQLLATDTYKTVKLWKADGTLVKTFDKTLEGHEIAFSPDGKLLATGSHDGTVKLWSSDGTLVKSLEAHRFSVSRLAFSPDGKLLLTTGNRDKTVKLWKVDGTLVQSLEEHQDRVYAVAFSPDGKLLATGSHDKTVKLWKPDGTLVKTLEGDRFVFNAVAFSSDGKLLATGSDDKTVKLWSSDGTLVKSLEGHQDSVYAVAFSSDGKLLATGSDDKTVKLWSSDGTLVKTLEGHKSRVYAVAFSPDGKLLATGSRDETVKLWKVDGTLVKTLEGHQDSVNAVAFSPDGKLLATGSYDNTVKLWKVDGTLVQSLEGHQNRVIAVAFNPDGKLLATGSWDKTVKLWSSDGSLVKTLEGHQDSVNAVAFSPDGKLLATGSWDKTVKLWNFNREALLKHACSSITGYLKNNPNLEEKERQVCGQVEPSATALFLQGEQLAAEGEIDKAVSKFQQADKLDPNFSFKVAATSLVRLGESLAEKGKIDEAILGFQKALEFDPSLKFNPKAKAAKNRFKRGQQLIESNQLDEVILAYNQAQELDPNLNISASDWNKLCWSGSVKKQADKVMFACNKAVELDPKNGWIRNSRGLARALTGDFKGAIEDFDVFVKLAGNAEEKKQRKAWIESLKKGKNPFTDEELEKLR